MWIIFLGVQLTCGLPLKKRKELHLHKDNKITNPIHCSEANILGSY
jgi:hypothetical protein